MYGLIVLMSCDCYLEYIKSTKMIFILPFVHFPIPMSSAIILLNAVKCSDYSICHYAYDKNEEKMLYWLLLQNDVN